MTTWGLYCRISLDRDGREVGVGDQEAFMRKRLAELGELDGVKVYRENNTSAFRRKRMPDGVYRVVRPVWTQWTGDLRRGVISAGMIYNLDRLCRDMRDLEDCVDVVEQYLRRIESYIPGDIDLTTDSGVTQARVMTAMNNKSSRDTSRRVRDHTLRRALAGNAPGGSRPFGWQESRSVGDDGKRVIDRTQVKPVEAEIIREIARRYLDGERLATLALELNDRGIVTSAGKRWTRTGLQTVLANPRLCGYRLHQGAVLTDAAGGPVIGRWETILSVDDSEALRDRLTTRAERSTRPTAHPHGIARRYVFSGILRCSLCKSHTKMGGNATPRRGAEQFVYLCPPRAQGGCGGLSVNGPKTDYVLSELVIAHLEANQVEATSEAAPWPRARDLSAELALAAETHQAITDHQVPAGRGFAILGEVDARVEWLRAEQRIWERMNATGRIDPSVSVRERWQAGSLEQRRDLALSVLDVVLVRPAVRGHVFNPDRLEPHYRD